MYYYYILVDGKYQLFISKNQDNILGGFVEIMYNWSNFVERLSELLTIANIKPTQLAKNLGVKSATITRYLSGIRKPRLEMLFKIADYFHCSIDFLLGRSDTGEHFDPLPYWTFIKSPDTGWSKTHILMKVLSMTGRMESSLPG